MITLAHQGGWDEFLFFVVPVALGLWALRRAEKRAKAKRATEQELDEAAP